MTTRQRVEKHLNTLCRPGAVVEMVKGQGYVYFTYDDPARNIWESETVNVYAINQLPLARWIEAGAAFIKSTEKAADDRAQG